MPSPDLPNVHTPDPQPVAARRRRKRPITVTVSGERGSGKTTLIAVVSAALENSGHQVQKDRFVPNASRAIADLHEQFDVTFVEQYDPDSDATNLRERNRELTERLAEFRENNIRVVEESRAVAEEAAKLRATIEELRGEVAGLSIENSRLRNQSAETLSRELADVRAKLIGEREIINRLVETDEKLRREIADIGKQRDHLGAQSAKHAYELEQANIYAAGLLSHVEMLNAALRSSPHIAPDDAARQVDMAFEEVRQAAYLEMERNRVRTEADELKHRARKLGHEGEARLTKARQRMMFALVGDLNVFVPDAEPVGGNQNNRPRGLMLVEQAAMIEAGAMPWQVENAIYNMTGTREEAATDKLAAANLALMADDDFELGAGC
jgi:chromosome segregation ATPase